MGCNAGRGSPLSSSRRSDRSPIRRKRGGDCCRCPIRWTQLFAKFGQLNNSSALFLGVSRLLGICVTLRKDRTQVIPFVIRQNDDCACERPPLFIAEQLPDPLIFGRDPGQCYYLCDCACERPPLFIAEQFPDPLI